ncbi:MAG TPA: thiamine/thiamine pyrophosphate ABC transporter permease [Dongiaceae bacterium]|jgi:thiamine transport system permease protein|nr:thiamine/thiamine pyrophosphate ABC transporter permease [Dongiaceae bacterium]
MRTQLVPARRPALAANAIGVSVALLVAVLVGAALLMLFAQAGDAEIGALLGSAYVWHILRFTLTQACLSTLLSAALGVLVARAFAREASFPGRRALLGLMSLPIVLPSLVAVFGIIAIYGQNGWLARALAFAGGDAKPDIYGLGGVVLAHVFFNLPLAVRLLLPGWHSIPVESWRLSAQLGMSGWSVFRLIEWPMLRRYLPHTAATIFMLCVGSFAIVLALGGGPGAATFEVAVFEALRFEFDPPKAAVLALGGLALNLICLALAQGAIGDAAIGSGWRTREQDWRQRGFGARLLDAVLIGAAALLLAGPVAATLIDGLVGLGQVTLNWSLVAQATLTSIGLAVPAALLTLLLALPIVLAEGVARVGKPARAAMLRGALILPIAVSPMALGLGCFLILRLALDGMPRAIIGIVLLNAIMTVPFAAAILRPAVERARARHDHLCRALGIVGWSRWRLIDWPILRPSIGTALAMAAAMALGDLVGIGLFGDAKIRNLTLLLYDQLGAYRMGGAAAVAALLMALIFALYQAIERLVGGRAAP